MILNKEEIDKIAERYVKMISENINVELIIPKDVIIDNLTEEFIFMELKITRNIDWQEMDLF